MIDKKNFDESDEELIENKINISAVMKQLHVSKHNNNRLLIIGPSGSGKTSTLIHLLLTELGPYKRIIYIHGSIDETFLGFVKAQERHQCNIEIVDVFINDDNLKLQINLLTKQLHLMNKDDLVLVDDLTPFMNKKNKLSDLLSTIFTVSRHKSYDVVAIMHKITLHNTLVRNNCTKLIFLGGVTKEVEKEYGSYISNPNINPIILNNENGLKQEYLDTDPSILGAGANDVMSSLWTRLKVTKSKSFKIPKITFKKPTKFVPIKNGTEEFNVRAEEYFKNIINESLSDGDTMYHRFDDDPNNKIITEDLNKVATDRAKINSGELNAGNTNVNVSDTNINAPQMMTTRHTKARKRWF